MHFARTLFLWNVMSFSLWFMSQLQILCFQLIWIFVVHLWGLSLNWRYVLKCYLLIVLLWHSFTKHCMDLVWFNILLINIYWLVCINKTINVIMEHNLTICKYPCIIYYLHSIFISTAKHYLTTIKHLLKLRCFLLSAGVIEEGQFEWQHQTELNNSEIINKNN
jgi:hypothetical protein